MALEAEAVDGAALLDLLGDGVGELDLAAGAGFALVEAGENVRGQDVAPDDGHGRGGFGRLRLLHHRANGQHPVLLLAVLEDAVGRGLLAVDLERRHDAALAVIGVDHLLEAGRAPRDHVVGQDHGEGLVADQPTRAPDSVTEAQRLLLADIGDGARGHGGALDLGQQIALALPLELVLELGRAVEVVLECRLAPGGDEDEVGDPGGARLVDAVLDQRSVDERQHLLRDRLRRRQEAGAEPRNRENRLRHLL